MSTGPQVHDVFICHASDDKATFADPLAHTLRRRGVDVWYDAFSIDWGDSLRTKIDAGIARSRFGIVILSRAFFAKNWPRYELDGLAGREMTSGGKIILPIWHGVDHSYVARYSPSLAERSALASSLGPSAIADKVEEQLQRHRAAILPAVEVHKVVGGNARQRELARRRAERQLEREAREAATGSGEQ